MNPIDHERLSLVWDRIELVGGLTIPSLTMIDEMVNPPKLDICFASRILKEYQLTGIIDLTNISNKNQPSDFWKAATKALSKTEYNQRAYIFFSLQQYRTSPGDDSYLSYSTLAAWNFYTVDAIRRLPRDYALEAFCANNNIPYLDVLYPRLVCTYSRHMMPIPLRYIKNVSHDYFVREVAKDMFEKVLVNPIGDSLFPSTPRSSKEQEEYLLKMEDTDIKLDIRFSERSAARNYLQSLDFNFVDELSDWHGERFQKFYDNVKTRNDERRSTNKDTTPTLPPRHLAQCQFCYRYRAIGNPLTRAAWYCDRPECQTAFKTWNKHLNRLSVKLETIYS